MSTRYPASALRIGDAERDRAIDALREHYAAGRLTKLEHEERTELALLARTGGDLDALFADLPLLDEPGADVARQRRRRGFPPVPRVVVAAVAAMLALVAMVQLIGVAAAVLIIFFVTRFVFGRHCLRNPWNGPRGYPTGRRW